MHAADTLEAILKRDRALVLGGLAALSALAWIATAQMARTLPHGHAVAAPVPSLTLPHAGEWGSTELGLLFIMWTVMMAAMMLPSTAPMVLVFSAISRKQAGARDPVVSTATFLAGYLLVWTGFSALGTLAQWGLQRMAWLTPAGESASPLFGGALLLMAGIFQWTPWKDACLSKCRSPLGFLMTRWRQGTGGALRMGLEHGAFCVGCCWALMALMFVAGMMNLLWLAVLAIFCLLEKVVPAGRLVRHLSGVSLVAWGLYLINLGL